MIVVAIIVTYRPDLGKLAQILRVLAEQCQVVIADNAVDPVLGEAIAKCLTAERGAYVSMHGNRGIGAAQNRAIAIAWSMGADAVVLLDDDSIPSADLVERLIACSEALGENAVVGAGAIDGAGRIIDNARRVLGERPRCRDMMSSGTLVRRDIFESVGPFDESLFVDGVDFDWGWRAQAAGIGIHVCRATAIVHQLGEGEVAGVRYPSPIRHYFQYRNIIRLIGRPYAPWGWRFSQVVKLAIKPLAILLLMPQPWRRLAFAWAGIVDAACGVAGPWRDDRPVVAGKPPSHGGPGLTK